MATVGDQLLQPEAGWKRYEETAKNITYVGNWANLTEANSSEGKCKYSSGINTDGFMFNFVGDKLRIFGYVRTSGYSPTVQIKIDGIAYTYSHIHTSNVYGVLLFEKTNLSNDIHTVEVISNHIIGGYINLDAIDVDINGMILPFTPSHPTLPTKTNLNDMSIGDAISCEYKAFNGKVGIFNNLGVATKPLLPLTGTSTPDGSFFFIKVSPTLLIPDRVLQINLPLNDAKLISGVDINNLKYTKINNDTDTHIIQSGSLYHGALKNISDDNVETFTVISTPTTNVGLISIDCNNSVLIERFVLRNVNHNVWYTMYPKNFKLQGSNTGGANTDTWEDIFIGNTDGCDSMTVDTFEFENTKEYRWYRLFVIDNWGYGSYIGIGDFELYTINTPLFAYDFSTRLLTGGGSTDDIDNEWNKFICESDLNNKITPGDNTIWNWENQWTGCIISNSEPVEITSRGYSEVDAWDDAITSNIGFRPMLLTQPFPLTLNNLGINYSQLWDSGIDSVNITGELLNNTNSKMSYSILINDIETYRSTSTTTSLSINNNINKDILNIGDNILILIATDEYDVQVIFKYILNLPDRDTILYNLDLTKDNSIQIEGDVSRSNEGFELSVVGSGEFITNIPTNGKSKINSISINSDIDINNIFDMHPTLNNVGVINTGIVYKSSLNMNYKSINNIIIK